MFSDEPLPVRADALTDPDLAAKAAAYCGPLRDLAARGVPAVRFPVPLRELDATPELMAMLGDRRLGFAAYQAHVGATSDRAADAQSGLAHGSPALAARVASVFHRLREAEPAARADLARDIDAATTRAETAEIVGWSREEFTTRCIARLCRQVKIEPVDDARYAAAMDAFAGRWSNDPHAAILQNLAEDRSVTAALARMVLRRMPLRTLSDSGIETATARQAGLGRRFRGAEQPAQTRRIVTDGGVLHLAATVGKRVELSVMLAPEAGRATPILKSSRRVGPDLLSAIAEDLQRALH